MDNEKWLHMGTSEGKIKRHDHPHQKLDLRGRRFKVVQLVAAALLFGFLFSLNFDHARFFARSWIEDAVSRAEDEMVCDFSEIIPSEKLQWHPCFNVAQCARLTVPMDYNRPLNASNDNPKVHIALAMIPGANHTKTGEYSASPLLVNPGGPGGPGASFAVLIGKMLQRIVASDRSQDVIGFDPRGIGATTPQANCWALPPDGTEPADEDRRTGAFNQMIWTLMGVELPLVNDTQTALAQRDSRARAAAKLCKQQDDFMGEDSILRHVSTPAVAQDMLSIIDAWDEWRASTGQIDTDKASETIESKESKGKPYSLDVKSKLVYWGFSYGTLLGATFAAMFPQRVGRVLLDGVVDADCYVSETWAESLRDTDRIEEMFHYYCHKAERSCALYRKNDTQANIKARFEEVFQNLRDQPFYGISPYQNLPFTLTVSVLKNFLFVGLYSPIHSFPSIGRILDAFYRADYEAMLYILPVIYPSYETFCNKTKPFAWPSQDAQLAIMCTDKRYPLNESLPNLKKRFDSIATTSHYADVWMSLMIGCDAYDITPTDPPMRWDDHPSHRQSPINTSFPLMFLSNTLDPVTPLFAGVKMARKFVDAGLLEQQTEGHCSIASVSRCALGKVRAYFERGVVPETPEWGPAGRELEGGAWMRCEADEWPWKPFEGAKRMEGGEEGVREREGGAEVNEKEMEALVEEELKIMEMMEAWKEVQSLAKSYIRPVGLSGGRRTGVW